MQGVQQQLLTPVQRSEARKDLDFKAQQTRNRLSDQSITPEKKGAIEQFLNMLRGEVSNGAMLAGNAVRGMAAVVAAQNQTISQEELINLFSKNLKNEKQYTSERLQQKINQIQQALDKPAGTLPAAPSNEELSQLINNTARIAPQLSVELSQVESKITQNADVVSKANNLASSVENLVNSLSQKPNASTEANGYFSGFVSQRDNATNIDKLKRAFETVGAKLNGTDVHPQELEKAVDIIKTFNTAAE